MGNQEYLDIITATQNMLTIHRTSLKEIEKPTICPQHELLSLEKKWDQSTSTTGKEQK